MNDSFLEKTLKLLDPPNPRLKPLPLGHISCSKWFSEIAALGHLKTRYCKIFRKQKLYMFYGGLLYRPHCDQITDASYQPIGFLFSPILLRKEVQFYPFDTGAMAKGLYGKKWGYFCRYKENFKFSGKKKPEVPADFVGHVFEDNKKYIAGVPTALALTKPAPFPDLLKFYTNILGDADHRMYAIECQFERSIKLDLKLIWIGYPDRQAAIFREIYNKLEPHCPFSDEYISRIIYRPNEVAAMLEVLANKQMEKYLE